MSRMLSTFKTRMAKRALYVRTLRELRAMPLDTALDLDIHRGDAARIAAQAVYGTPRL